MVSEVFYSTIAYILFYTSVNTIRIQQNSKTLKQGWAQKLWYRWTRQSESNTIVLVEKLTRHLCHVLSDQNKVRSGPVWVFILQKINGVCTLSYIKWKQKDCVIWMFFFKAALRSCLFDCIKLLGLHPERTCLMWGSFDSKSPLFVWYDLILSVQNKWLNVKPSIINSTLRVTLAAAQFEGGEIRAQFPL